MGIGGYALPVFLKPVVAELGWSRTSYASASAIMSSAVALVGPLIGWASQRLGPRAVLAAGSLLVSASLYAAGSMETTTHLYLVGIGIGVMAIMMVSVTSRTREIGTRKALGATRREILWQFLVEAASLTALGGVLGILAGLLFGELIKLGLKIEANPPLWSAVVAVVVSVAIGLGFGLYPANRAARMDPVEALRHE